MQTNTQRAGSPYQRSGHFEARTHVNVNVRCPLCGVIIEQSTMRILHDVVWCDLCVNLPEHHRRETIERLQRGKLGTHKSDLFGATLWTPREDGVHNVLDATLPPELRSRPPQRATDTH